MFFKNVTKGLICIVDWIANYSNIVVAIATVAIAFFTYTLWRTSRKQSMDIKASIAVSKNAADAANKSATLQKIAMINTQRAFLYLTKFTHNTNINLESRLPIQFTLTSQLLNSGKTPAINAQVHMINQFFDTSTPDEKIVPNIRPPTREEQIKCFIGPTGTFNIPDIVIDPKEATAVFSKAKRLFVWVFVEYNDMFEGTPLHYTNYWAEVLISYDPSKPIIDFDKAPDFFRYKIFWKYNSAD